MKKTVLTVLATIILASAALSSQQQQFFRSSVRTVPIYATVLDSSGRMVPDLKQADFEVFDNGRPAPISVFAAEVQPIAVVTALDMSGSMTLVLDLVKHAAEAFVLRLLPHDRARIVGFDDKTRWSPGGFTDDRDFLIRYLREGMQFGNGTRLWDAVYEGIDQLKEENVRRVVLVLSDGDDTTSRLGGSDVLDQAQALDVMVYAIGLRNRYRGGPNGSYVESRPDRYLRRMTEQTGGGYFELTRATELNSTFSRVADELHRQYLIAIPAEVLDGKVHTLDVRVKTPGMKVRARKTYTASKEPVPSS